VRLFGGYALSRDGLQFAWVSGNTLYFTVDDLTRPQYEQRGMQYFAYLTARRRVQVRSYYEVPEEILTDEELLCSWVLQALEVAERKKLHAAQNRRTEAVPRSKRVRFRRRSGPS